MRDTDTERRRPWDDRGRDWSNAPVSQGPPRVVRSHPRSRKRPGDTLACHRSLACRYTDLGFCSPEL